MNRLSKAGFETIRDKYRQSCADAAGVKIEAIDIANVSMHVYVYVCMRVPMLLVSRSKILT